MAKNINEKKRGEENEKDNNYSQHFIHTYPCRDLVRQKQAAERGRNRDGGSAVYESIPRSNS